MPKHLKHIFFTLNIYCLLSFGCVNASENTTLTLFESTYDLRGFGVLEVKRSVALLHENDDYYILRATNTASGLAALAGYGPIIEEARFMVVAGQIRPLKYKNVDESGITGLDDTIVFNWENQTARSKRKGITHSIPISTDILDPLTIVLRVRLDLKAGLRPEIYKVHETEAIRTYRISYLSTDKIFAANMELDGIHLAIDAGRVNRTLHYWLAPALDYLPIQMHQVYKEKVEVRAILTSTSLLPTSTPSP